MKITQRILFFIWLAHQKLWEEHQLGMESPTHPSRHPMLNYDWVNQRDYTGVGRFFEFLKNRDFGFLKYSRIKEPRVLIGFKKPLKKTNGFFS